MLRLILVLSLCLFSAGTHAQDDEFDDVDMDAIEAPVKKKKRVKKEELKELDAPKEGPSATEATPSATAETMNAGSDEALLEETAEAKPVKKKKKRTKKKMAGTKKKTRSKKTAGRSSFYHVGLGYALGGKVKFDVDHESTIQPFESTSANFKVDAGIELSGGYMYMPQNAWGYGGTLAFQLKRDITGTLDGADIGTGSGIQFIILEGFGIYRFQQVYFPIGLNFTVPSFSGGSSGFDTKVKGDIGFHLGVGSAPPEGGLFYEGQIKMLGVQAQTEAVTETYTYKTAYLTSLEFKFGYLF